MASIPSKTQEKSVLTLLTKAKNMPHLMDKVLSNLGLKDLKMLSYVSKHIKTWAKEIYDKRSLNMARNLLDNFPEDRNSLWHASSIGNVDWIVLLIENGADVTKVVNNTQPLEMAVRNGHVEAVKVLLAEVGPANASNALEIAVLWRRIDIVSYLLSQGAVVTASVLYLAIDTADVDIFKMFIANGISDDHLTKSLAHACRKGNLDFVKILVQLVEGQSGISGDQLTECLQETIDRDHLDVMKFLVELAGQSGIPISDDQLVKCLQVATYNRNLDITQFLVELAGDAAARHLLHDGSSQNGQRQLNRAFFQPLYGGECLKMMTYFVSLDCAKELIEYSDNFGMCVLCEAARGYTNRENVVDVIELLLSKGANVNGVRASPLKVAITRESEKAFQVLLKNGASLDESEATFLLHHAAFQGQLQAVRWLVELFKADIHAKNDSGKAAVQIARENSHDQIVHYFLFLQ